MRDVYASLLKSFKPRFFIFFLFCFFLLDCNVRPADTNRVAFNLASWEIGPCKLAFPQVNIYISVYSLKSKQQNINGVHVIHETYQREDHAYRIHRKGHYVKLSVPDVFGKIPWLRNAPPPPVPPLVTPPSPVWIPVTPPEISQNERDNLTQSNSIVKPVIIAVLVTAVAISVLLLVLACCYRKFIKPKGKILDDSLHNSNNDIPPLLETKIRSDSLDVQHDLRCSQGSITKVEIPALSAVQYEHDGSRSNESSESLLMVQQQNLGCAEWIGRTGFRNFSNMPSDVANSFAIPYMSSNDKNTVAISSLNLEVSNATLASAIKSQNRLSTTNLYRLPAPQNLTSSVHVTNHVKTKSFESIDSFPGFWPGCIERSSSSSDSLQLPQNPIESDLYPPFVKTDNFIVTKHVSDVTYCNIPSSIRSYSSMSAHHIVQKADHDEVCDLYPVPASKASRNNVQTMQKSQAINKLIPKTDSDELSDLFPLPSLANVRKSSTSANSHNIELLQKSPIESLVRQPQNSNIHLISGFRVEKAASVQTAEQNQILNLHPLPPRPLGSVHKTNSKSDKYSQSVCRPPSAISMRQDNVPVQIEALRLVPSSRLPYRGMSNTFSQTNIISQVTGESPQPFLASNVGNVVSLSATTKDKLIPTSLIASGNPSPTHVKNDPITLPPTTRMIEKALSISIPDSTPQSITNAFHTRSSPDSTVKQVVSQTNADMSAAAVNSPAKTILLPPPAPPVPLAAPISVSKTTHGRTLPPAPPAPPVLPVALKGPAALPPSRPPYSSRSTRQLHSASGDNVLKLKPFHWEKLQADPSQSMVWDKLKNGSFELNEDEIKMLFPSSTTSKVGSKPPQILKAAILDSKKAQNIAIQLKALNISAHVVCDAILEGDGLSPELLQELVKMSPSQEEIKRLLTLKNGEQQLGPAESFLKSVLEVPNAFERLEAMRFKSCFKDEVAHLKKSLDILESACDQVRENRLLLKLLEAVLKTGNHMNKGTKRGDAEAFKLDALLKLSDVKSTDGKTTLMHFVVEEIIKVEGQQSNQSCTLGANDYNCLGSMEDMVQKGLEVLMTFCNDLGIVREAARLDANELQKCLLNLSDGIALTKARLAWLKPQDLQITESKDRFRATMEAFCSHGQQDVMMMEQEMSRVFDKLTKAHIYFHGSEKEKEPLSLMIIIGDLKHLLEKVCKDVAKQHKVKIRS